MSSWPTYDPHLRPGHLSCNDVRGPDSEDCQLSAASCIMHDALHFTPIRHYPCLLVAATLMNCTSDHATISMTYLPIFCIPRIFGMNVLAIRLRKLHCILNNSWRQDRKHLLSFLQWLSVAYKPLPGVATCLVTENNRDPTLLWPTFTLESLELAMGDSSLASYQNTRALGRWLWVSLLLDPLDRWPFPSLS